MIAAFLSSPLSFLVRPLPQELASISGSGLAKFVGNEKSIEGSSADITGARLVTEMVVNDEPRYAIEISEGVKKHKFGETLDLSEQEWLVYQINSFVEKSRRTAAGDSVDYDAGSDSDA